MRARAVHVANTEQRPLLLVYSPLASLPSNCTMLHAHQHSYQSLTIKTKLIINAVEKAPTIKKKKEIAAEFYIPQSTEYYHQE